MRGTLTHPAKGSVLCTPSLTGLLDAPASASVGYDLVVEGCACAWAGGKHEAAGVDVFGWRGHFGAPGDLVCGVFQGHCIWGGCCNVSAC